MGNCKGGARRGGTFNARARDGWQTRVGAKLGSVASWDAAFGFH